MVKYLTVIAALALASPVQAQEARVDPDHIMAVLKDAGYPAEYFNDDDDYRQILSKTGNYQFLIEMYDCVDGKACQTLEFYSNFPMEEKPSKEMLEAYSGPREGTRIVLDRRGEATVRQELDLNGAGGLTDEQFIASVKTWETIVTGFTAYLTQPAAAAAAAPAPAAAPATS